MTKTPKELFEIALAEVSETKRILRHLTKSPADAKHSPLIANEHLRRASAALQELTNRTIGMQPGREG